MTATRTPRIVIEDLPALETLSAEEQAAIIGAGRPQRAPLGFDQAERWDLMAANWIASIAAPLQLSADANGDHRIDRVAAYADDKRGLVVQSSLANANATNSMPIETVLGDGKGVFQNPVKIADVNADGRDDLVFTFYNQKTGTHVRTALAQADGRFSKTVETVLGDGNGVFQQPVQVGDINGDGRDDLVFSFYNPTSGARVRTALGKSDGRFSNTVETVLGDGNGVFQQPLKIGDVNADGRDDLIFSFFDQKTGARVRTALGKADGHVAKTVETVLGDGNGVFQQPVQVGDVNADGREDLIFSFHNSQTGAHIRTALAKANGKFATTVDTTLGDGAGIFQMPTRLEDVNSDGKVDLTFRFTDSAGNVQERTSIAQTGGRFASNVRAQEVVALSGGRAAAWTRDAAGIGTLQIYDGAKWIASSVQGQVQGLYALDNGKAAVLILNVPAKNNLRGGGVFVAPTRSLLLIDGVSTQTIATNVKEVVALNKRNAYSFYNASGKGFVLEANGVSAAAYSGTQKIVQMVAAGGGVVTRFDGGGAYFSPDGKNLGGGGSTVKAYSGTQTIKQITAFAGGVVTQFSGGGYYFSPNGRSLGGGGSSFKVDPLGNGQYTAQRGDVLTIFDGQQFRPYSRQVTATIRSDQSKGYGLFDGGSATEFVDDLANESLEWIKGKLGEMAEEEMQKFADKLLQQVADVVFKEQTNRETVRAAIAAGKGDGGGWIVAYGDEFDTPDYLEAVGYIAASVASGNPGPLMGYFKQLIDRNIIALKESFKGLKSEVLESTFVKLLTDKALKGSLESMRQTIEGTNVQVKLGIATYSSTGSGVATAGQKVDWLNHYQVYVAFRFVVPGTDQVIQPTGEVLKPAVVSGAQLVNMTLYTAVLVNEDNLAKTVKFRWGTEYAEETFYMAPGEVKMLEMRRPAVFDEAAAREGKAVVVYRVSPSFTSTSRPIITGDLAVEDSVIGKYRGELAPESHMVATTGNRIYGGPKGVSIVNPWEHNIYLLAGPLYTGLAFKV
jgi:hypothetical protein